MTKKHFEAFARAIRQMSIFADKTAIADIVVQIAQESNPRFDKNRFLRACGIDR